MLSEALKDRIRPYVPEVLLRARSNLLPWRRDLPMLRLLLLPRGPTTLRQRSALVQQVRRAQAGLVCAHTPGEMQRIISAILTLPPSAPGCIVEAGCYKGGSTAKLSLAAKLAGRRLVVFDSFEGLPAHGEAHGRTIFGQQTDFYTGRYAGRLDEVKANVGRFGAIDVCDFVPGWFEDTLPQFHDPIAVAFVDVDLAASTRTCLQYLYPLLAPGGVIFSHDGHLPLCLQVIQDDTFWEKGVGAPRPHVPGLGRRKLLQISKPHPAR